MSMKSGLMRMLALEEYAAYSRIKKFFIWATFIASTLNLVEVFTSSPDWQWKATHITGALLLFVVLHSMRKQHQRDTQMIEMAKRASFLS